MFPSLDYKLKKHSVTIRGHATSYSLENEFYAILSHIAAEKQMPLAALITLIDKSKPNDCNLSSALRLHVLHYLKEKAASGNSQEA